MRSFVPFGGFAFLLLLSVVAGFLPKVSKSALRYSGTRSFRAQENPETADPQEASIGFAKKTRHGERRRKLVGIVKKAIPKKRNVACLAIAIMAYLRGPSMLSCVDPNIAHAGVSVKISGAKVGATIKDIPLLIPTKLGDSKALSETGATGSVKTVTPKDVRELLEPALKLAKRAVTSDIPNIVTSAEGSLVIAAGGGILAGVYSRRTSSDVKGSVDGGKAERDAQTQEYVTNVLKPIDDDATG